VTVTSAEIHEEDCASPDTSQVSVELTAHVPLSAVRLHWEVGGLAGVVDMQPAGGGYAAPVGPFDEHTVPADTAVVLLVEVIAGADRLEHPVPVTTLTLLDCVFG
jgi:hypothetical protein